MKIILDMVEVHLFRQTTDGIEFLLLKRSDGEIYPGLWQMITGHIEQSEKAWQTALREIKEETGIEPVQFWVVPNVNHFYAPDDDSITLLPVFAARINPQSDVTICSEHCDSGWFKPEEAKKLLAWVGQRKSVDIITEYFTKEISFLNFVEIKL